MLKNQKLKKALVRLRPKIPSQEMQNTKSPFSIKKKLKNLKKVFSRPICLHKNTFKTFIPFLSAYPAIHLLSIIHSFPS
jgi:hypothetical protein